MNIILLFFLSTFFGPASSDDGPVGVYTYESHFMGPTGIVYIHPAKDGRLLYYFEFSTGEPSYNSWAFYGNLFKSEELIYNNQADEAISFKFESGFTEVCLTGELRGMVCYKRHRSDNPEFFINRKGEKIYFEETDPEDYSE